MAETALLQLQHQIDAIRKEAFAEGYAAGMKEVQELASRSTDRTAPAANGNGRGQDEASQPAPNTAAVPLRASTSVRRSPARRRTARITASGKRGSRGGRRQRGTNAVLVSTVLKAAAPRALRQAEIRRALQEKGATLSYPSIGHSLGQLVARNAARQVGNTKTWRHLAG